MRKPQYSIRGSPAASLEIDDLLVVLESVNSPPVANAGAAQTVDEGVTVVLDGSGSSDADAGDTLTYAWVAPAGITLSDVTVVNPVFAAPEVDSYTDFTIRLVVNDGQVDSVESTVVVTVNDVAPVSPSGSANEAEIRNSLSTLRDAALHFSIGHAPNDVNTTTIRHGLYAQSPFSPQGQIDLASSGFSLAALPAAVENGLITKDNAQVIALNAAARIKEMTHKSASASTDEEILKYGYKGMLYHFCDWNESDQKFHRSNTMGYEVEISSVDTAILMWGMFISANYFDGDVKADYLTARDSIDWSAWVDTDSDHLNQFRMAYQPGTGFAGWWDWYTQETMLIVLMAAMSNDDIVVEDLWRAWKREEVTYQSRAQF